MIAAPAPAATSPPPFMINPNTGLSELAASSSGGEDVARVPKGHEKCTAMHITIANFIISVVFSYTFNLACTEQRSKKN